GEIYMKKLLLYILALSNILLLSSENVTNIAYIKNTNHRKYSQFKVYDKGKKKNIANIVYSPNYCHIDDLFVDEKYREMGIGSELAKMAIADMRANYNCEAISLMSVPRAKNFWEKLGAQPSDSFMFSHAFP